MNGRYQVGSGRVVTFTHDIPFINTSISNPSKSVNTQNSEDAKGAMKADRATYMTARELLLQAMADEELKKSEVYPNQCFAKQSYLFETCQEFRTDKRVKK